MAPKKDGVSFARFKDDPQYYADFKQKIYNGYQAQKTDLDKFSYIMELSAMARDLLDINGRLQKPNRNISDFDSEEEYRKQLENDEIEYLSDEEKKELGFTDRKQVSKLNSIVDEAVLDFYQQYKQNRKESDLEQGVAGVMRGQAIAAAGKHFKELQDSDLLKDDPDRDLKLQRIVGQTEGTDHHSIDGAVKDMETTLTMRTAFGDEFSPDIKMTPLGNVGTLKKMTIGQVLDDFHLTDEVYERTLKSLAENTGREAMKSEDVRKINAYELLMDEYENTTHYKNNLKLSSLPEGNPDRRPKMTQKEKEENMIDHVRNNFFRKQEVVSRRIHAMQMYGATRPDEERKNNPVGLDIINGEYSKGFSGKYLDHLLDPDQVNQQLNPIIQKGRVERFKKRLQHHDELLEEAQKPLRMDRKEPYAQMFPPVNRSEKSYDNYIRLHSGIHVMNTKQNYRELLAKVLAAEAMKNSGQSFDVKKVRHMAKSIQKLPALQKLKNDEIVAALSTDPQRLKDMQQTVYLDSFTVKPENAAKYIEDMRTLQKSMMTSKDRSPEYQKFTAAVEEVAKLKPGSKDFADASRKANEALLKSINIYSRDKEKVRTFDGGVARFDNTMDALSIMKAHIPGIKDVIDARVDAINKTRGAESVDHKDHLDLSKYGAGRAQTEYEKRTGQPAQEKEQIKDDVGPILS